MGGILKTFLMHTTILKKRSPLPLHTKLTDEDVEYVIDNFKFIAKGLSLKSYRCGRDKNMRWP